MWYIVGASLGSFVILIFLALLVRKALISRSYKRLIKKIGQTAEEEINGELKKWARYEKYQFIGSTIFAYNNNKVFETDAILVFPYGLVVIEIKSISGDVTGDAKAEKWLKTKNGHSKEITNPVKQNDRHIDHILTMAQMKVPTISLIIFSDRVDSLKITNLPGHALVVKKSHMYDALNTIMTQLNPNLNLDDQKHIFNSIMKFKANKTKVNLHKKITKTRR